MHRDEGIGRPSRYKTPGRIDRERPPLQRQPGYGRRARRPFEETTEGEGAPLQEQNQRAGKMPALRKQPRLTARSALGLSFIEGQAEVLVGEGGPLMRKGKPFRCRDQVARQENRMRSAFERLLQGDRSPVPGRERGGGGTPV